MQKFYFLTIWKVCFKPILILNHLKDSFRANIFSLKISKLF